MGSSVKTAFHFRLASIGFPSASESLERKDGEGPRQEGCQDPKEGSSKEICCQKASGKGKENSSKEGNQKGCKESNSQKGSSKEDSSKEAKGKEASISKEGQKASSKEGKEASTKERQKCTQTSNVCFLLVCSRRTTKSKSSQSI